MPPHGGEYISVQLQTYRFTVQYTLHVETSDGPVWKLTVPTKRKEISLSFGVGFRFRVKPVGLIPRGDHLQEVQGRANVFFRDSRGA